MTQKQLKALIFDVDNTICETEDLLHRPCYNEARALYGLPPWSSERFCEICKVAGGMERLKFAFDSEGWPAFVTDKSSFLEEFYAKKTEIYKAAVKVNPPPTRNGIIELLDAAHSAGLKLGIASASAKPSVLSLLPAVLGERFSYFSAIFAGADVKNKKPNPEIYEKCLAALGVDADECCVFEDTQHGMWAAKDAGCCCIVAYDDYSKDHDFSRADFVCDDLKYAGVNLDFVKVLVSGSEK